MHGRPPAPMSHQSRGLSRCQKGARSRAHDFGKPTGIPNLGKTGRCVSSAAFSDSAKRCPLPTGAYVGCIMQFSRIISFVDLQIWNATSNGFSFVISFESRNGPGLHGRLGFVASWRPIYQNRSAIKVGGSPFKTLAEAENACMTMLVHLIRDSDSGATPPA